MTDFWRKINPRLAKTGIKMKLRRQSSNPLLRPLKDLRRHINRDLESTILSIKQRTFKSQSGVFPLQSHKKLRLQ